MFEDIEKKLDKNNEALALRIAIVDNCIAMNEDINIEDFCKYIDTDIVQLNSIIEMFDFYCENIIKAYKGVENE